MLQGQADTEWKFARTKLWIDCFEKTSTLPSPYNILPNRNTFEGIFKCFRKGALDENQNKTNVRYLYL